MEEEEAAAVLLEIQQHISTLSPVAREEVRRCALVLRTQCEELGYPGLLALALVGSEAAAGYRFLGGIAYPPGPNPEPVPRTANAVG